MERFKEKQLILQVLHLNTLSKFSACAPSVVVKFSAAAHTNSSHRLLPQLQHQDSLDTIIRRASKTKLNCLKNIGAPPSGLCSNTMDLSLCHVTSK